MIAQPGWHCHRPRSAVFARSSRRGEAPSARLWDMRRPMRLFALLLVLAGCSGGQAAHQEPAPPADSASVARPAGLELKPATAEEILGALEGSKSKAVLVNVWATWCAP